MEYWLSEIAERVKNIPILGKPLYWILIIMAWLLVAFILYDNFLKFSGP